MGKAADESYAWTSGGESTGSSNALYATATAEETGWLGVCDISATAENDCAVTEVTWYAVRSNERVWALRLNVVTGWLIGLKRDKREGMITACSYCCIELSIDFLICTRF